MIIFRVLKLLLPAVIPAWRFFDVIAPSPRIQFTVLQSSDKPSNENQQWHEFHLRPARLSFLQMLGRMFWNPERNESLFMVSCAERILQQPTEHSENEILKRISAKLKADGLNSATTTVHLQFRLLLIQRKNSQLRQKVVFHSRVQSLPMQDVV